MSELVEMYTDHACRDNPGSGGWVTILQYMVKGIAEWIIGFKKRNWQAAANKPVKNTDLGLLFNTQLGRDSANWLWVQGHMGNEGNELAYTLAK